MNFRFEDLPVFIPLPPEDLRFFYYDVAKYGEKEQLLECSNEELVEFANEFGIKLTPIQQQRWPHSHLCFSLFVRDSQRTCGMCLIYHRAPTVLVLCTTVLDVLQRLV
jgi:hypothetical protein